MELTGPVLLGLGLLVGVLGFACGAQIARGRAGRGLRAALSEAESLREEARREIDLARRSAAVEAREREMRDKERFEAEAAALKAEIDGRRRIVEEGEAWLRNEAAELQERDRRLESGLRDLAVARDRCEERDARLATLIQEQSSRLEKLSGLTASEARRELLKQLEDEVRRDVARMGQRLREAAQRDADREAKRLILLATQRLAAEHSIESTVSVLSLPNDEMKGRIIGREGRNIRSFEQATGVDVIIDDTPEAVLLSAFDPMRREIARVALERLVADGRIHPARIEEVVAKAAEEVLQAGREAAEKAAIEVGIHGLSPEVADLLGPLRFRTSSGQNVLRHSIEVAHLSGIIAAELGYDVDLARRAGLLHDIGKGADAGQEGPHARIGMEMLRRHGEPEAVCEAVGAHHGEIETDAALAALVMAADAISGARPGARRENLEAYVKRLRKLEELAESFSGVERSYAVQAGREVRILVHHQAVDDESAAVLATEIARKIEKELQYPGQIKVVVIREIRAIEYAR